MQNPLRLIVICIIPFIISSCWLNKDESTKSSPVIKDITLVDILAKYSTGEAQNISTTINSSDFSENERLIQKLIDDARSSWKTNTWELVTLLIFQLQNTLNQSNYEYTEAEGRTNAAKIIETILSYDPNYSNHPDILMFRGYAEEINKNYTGAIVLYQNAIGQSMGFSGNTAFRSRALIQLSHIESLMGNMDRAYELAREGYALDPTNYKANLSIGRFLAYSGSIVEALPYFENALNTPYKPMKSEIYFSMSSLVANKWSKAHDLNKAIEYAKLSIENNPNYPMGYYALAYAYYMMNDPQYHQTIQENLDKSIELNPNGYNSYELRGLLKFDIGDYDGAVDDIKTAIDVIPRDVILMWWQRGYHSNRLYMLILLMNYIQSQKPIDDTFWTLFLTSDSAWSNVMLQFDRPNNWFLKDSGDEINLLLQK